MTASSPDQTLVILAAGQAKRYGGGLKPLAAVGPEDEAILDLLASDAFGAGFTHFVVVVSPTSGPTIRDHIKQHWPAHLDVRFAVQETPRGTVDAVLSAFSELDGATRFGVSNADDLYGPASLRILSEHLASANAEQALVGFALERAVIGASPVTRGVCQITSQGYLSAIEERRGVTRRDDGTFATGDDRSPEVLGADTIVSMNLWGLRSALADDFAEALRASRRDEVLLPEVVGELIARPEDAVRFQVLPSNGRCVGVTHPGDLELVRADVRAQIERGERPGELWMGV